jgi:hypothetical protein
MTTDTHYKRPKTIESKTEHVETSCGTMHFTTGYDTGLVEIRAMIGKSGTCPNCQLDNFCRVVSMYLQSPEPRYRIVKKFRKQFEGANCGMPFTWKEKKYTSCHDYIAQAVIKELEK